MATNCCWWDGGRWGEKHKTTVGMDGRHEGKESEGKFCENS